ncbi:fucolectin [Patella vulgata]|uniref:fucolectin n=1 Tax=Patella vulgata TaxID=6465 RepID=UPI00217F94AB|nr:fucolectin [Patella vulgata]
MFQYILIALTVTLANAVNIALNKPARQITTLGPTRFATKANDGSTTPATDPNCAHTLLPLSGIPNWWYVDLQSSYTINSVGIRNRDECCSHRTSDFYITVWEFDPGPHIKDNMEVTYFTCKYYAGQVPTSSVVIIPCTTTCTGRFVALILTKRTEMNICEVEVYGTPAPLPLRTSMKISKFKNKKAIPSVTPTVYNTQNILQCSIMCMKDDQCFSFNYKFSAGGNCELLSVGVHPIEETVVSLEWTWSVLSKRNEDVCKLAGP